MDATFQLIAPGPAPRALLLALGDRARARDAPDRRIPDVVQRVVRDLVHDDVSLHALRVPVGERVDLPHAVALAPRDLLQIGARRALVAADAADPRVVRCEGALERLDLADMTAAVRVALPEVRSF